MSKSVSFAWPHPGGGNVQLAGSFSNWQPLQMNRNPSDDGGWSLTVTDVAAGRHEFKFVVDGEWVHDASQPGQQNEMGSHNNFVDVVAAAAATASKAVKPIEVERKFVVPSSFRATLPENGYKLVKEFEENLSDTYYDTPAFALLKSDHWLRMRNSDWEMKYPVGSLDDEEENNCTHYHETRDAEDIACKIGELTQSLKTDLAGLVASGGLHVFAHLETKRLCYKKEEVNVVVDFADWGYSVGEIEIVVTNKNDVGKAARKIDAIAEQLGLETVIMGKLHSYLREHNAKAYDLVLSLVKKKTKMK